MTTGDASKASFWRTFAVALGLHSIAIVIAIGLAGGSHALALTTVLFGACVLGVWAALASRGAVVALIVILLVSTLSSVVAIVLDHDFAVAFATPLDAVAMFYAWQSFPRASSYLEDKRHQEQAARRYEREERWRPGSGW